MADVTGPISSLPGSLHRPPKGMKCDDCSEAFATVRVQGETDSFGCEMIDLCDACRAKDLGQEVAAEAIPEKCDWCKSMTTDARPTRDWEEGSCGPVYRVCSDCRKRRTEQDLAELEQYDDWE